MTSDTPLQHKKAFSIFRSAAEEAATRLEHEMWDNEGGHMSATAGRVMRSPNTELPYTVILQRHLSEATEQHFATMREAEAFIRRNTPVPGATLSALYDRPASEP